MDVSRAAALTDDRMAAFRAEVDAPAVAYGLVKDGELVHASGAGALADGRVPGPDDVFRIASMTKSFTASAVLLLRDRGRLRLDDELATHLPWAAGLTASGGGPEIRICDLLAMNASRQLTNAQAEVCPRYFATASHDLHRAVGWFLYLRDMKL